MPELDFYCLQKHGQPARYVFLSELTRMPSGHDRPAILKETGEKFYWGEWYFVTHQKTLEPAVN